MADKSAHKERTRSRILDEAAQALRLHGTEGVSVAQLMKLAGLTHGGFYAHFSSRDDLVAHAIDRMFEDTSLLVERFLTDRPPSEGLADLIDHYLSERAFGQRAQGCPLPGLAGEAHRMPTEAKARFEQGFQKFRNAIATALEKMGKQEPDRLASSIVAELVGTMALARSFSDRQAALDMLAGCRSNLKQRILET